MYYDGGPLINDSETRTELAEGEITKINQALIQYDPAVEDEKNSTPADLVVDGDESSVSDFLIGYLTEYIQSEGYLDRKANYEAITAIRKITYLSRGLLTFRQITLVRTNCPFMS